MYRNDAVVPFFSIVFSIGFFLMMTLNQSMRVVHEPGVASHLTAGSIGLLAFSIVLFVYGFIGLISNWLEGEELTPGRHNPEPSSLPVVAGVVLSLLLVLLSGFFVRTLIPLKVGEEVLMASSAVQGTVFGSMMLIIAMLVAIYKKFFQEEEILAEDEKSDFPW